jgi:Reverse transcriptase (RNA-dependent DNA polymerase)
MVFLVLFASNRVEVRVDFVLSPSTWAVSIRAAIKTRSEETIKDGCYRARLCALGYSQIPGLDYNDSHSPVVNDITFRIVLTLMVKNKWKSQVVDVTTAFLYGDMEEQVFMSMPEGLEYTEPDWDPNLHCAELKKTIYGTKQASRQYWRKFISTMALKGFNSIHIDTCLLVRKDTRGVVIICVYVDDCLLTGDTPAINAAMDDIESEFGIRRLGKLNEYIGCTIKQSPIDGSAMLIQPKIIDKLRSLFHDYTSKERHTTVPMGPGKMIISPTDDETKVPAEQQHLYRKRVGTLLYLVKHSRPDLGNAVRELAKVMDGATEDHLKLLFRTIQFTLDTKHRGLWINPTTDMSLEAYVNSDYAGDKETRKSNTGYITYFCGVAVAWKLKQQGGVTLSTTSKAEYYALSEVATVHTELLFIKQLLDFLEVNVQQPMRVNVDNTGAIQLANNAMSGTRTKHVDTRVHFVRDLTQSVPKILETVYVETDKNQADTFTKNVSTDTFFKHTNKYMVYDPTGIDD